MPIVEDDVKKAIEVWLRTQGYSDVVARFGTRQGYDVEGKPGTPYLKIGTLPILCRDKKVFYPDR